MAHPYVGINGITTIKEMIGVRKAFSDVGYFSASTTGHVPMTGFLASDSTVRGEKYNTRYPIISKLKKMIMHAASTNPCIHYYTQDEDKLSMRVLDLFERLNGGAFIKALQINVAFPPLKEIMKIKEKYPKIEFILPVTTKMIFKQNPGDLALRTSKYSRVADHILIDFSEGQGAEINTNYAYRVYSALKSKIPHSVYGFAGGFNDKNIAGKISELSDLIKTCDYSVDVESGVRTDNKLSTAKVHDFLANAHDILA